ncbi:YbjN domain-containing protein [Mycobacterium sp.]|uniref:YbjN domain-containing protein n=1 Tax=Mycobacterium sp. TaxID=1785 RepID=UPI003C761002
MTTEPRCANLIEHYLRTRGRRYFRGHHDGDYFFVASARPRRLHVHLEICPPHDDVLIIRVAPGCFFPATDRPWLTYVADSWNRQDREVTAIVHGSSDPQRIGVVARRSRWIRDNVSFEDFTSFVDRTIADAIDFFSELTPVVEFPSTAQPWLRDAS